ncbi:hypothetical protein FB451DRAFT_1141381 [Mycena latifolia]|nr:hypothetical protein FB451DRAFT_1141381 [Mycena latifolia]
MESFKAMIDATPPRPILHNIPALSTSINFSLNAGTVARRPHTHRIQKLQRIPDRLDRLCPPNSGDRTICFVRSNALKGKADLQFADEQYAEARSTYISAASEMVASPLPSSPANSGIYRALGPRDGWDAIDLMACLNGAIECSRKLLDYDSALLWVEEADILDKSLEAAVRASSFEWTPMQSTSSDYYFERLTTLCLASQVFFAVGNTGSAVHQRWLADEIFYTMPANLKTSQILDTALLGIDILRLRHPDPETVATLSINHPRLQLCGSWKKLNIPTSSGPGARTGSATCAFNGRLYVLGGGKFLEGPWYRDFWVLDLAKFERWEQLPDFPIPEEFTGDLQALQMVTHRDGRAFVFTGLSLGIAVFHTKQRKWEIMETTFTVNTQMPDWPYRHMQVEEYTAQCVGDRLYVFGGRHRGSVIGTDLLMELDIPKRNWRRLSGSAIPTPSASSPGPRMRCQSWVGKDATRIFFMFGQSDRPTAMPDEEPDDRPLFYSHAYGDLWSWDIQAEKWTRERLRGNVPSPRAEMACTYNPVLDKLIFFGGYSPSVPTWLDDLHHIVNYSYYADTFIADPNSRESSAAAPMMWKQVLTRGFPPYRAEATLVTDTKTGKVFLFGGYKNNVYVPSRNTTPTSSSRSFTDLWQLRLDLHGGFFDDVNLEEEARTAQAGPWQRCFTCGSAGPWKRCGGACNGRVFFCDSSCLKQGWKEHKEKHGCKKT